METKTGEQSQTDGTQQKPETLPGNDPRIVELERRLAGIENEKSNSRAEIQRDIQTHHDNFAEALNKLAARIDTLESDKPAKIDKAEIHAALEGHPLMAEFRAFIAKWRNR